VRERRLQLQAVRERLSECRRQLEQALGRPVPDEVEVDELLREQLLLTNRRLDLVARLHEALGPYPA
jgi:hypothetical protein